MNILNFLFKRREMGLPLSTDLLNILIIRTDERLGEIILTIPLINHLRKVYKDSRITFLMCRKYEGISKYIDCDDFIFFEKRDLFKNVIGFFAFIFKLLRKKYDLAVVGGKIYPPSLTSYILLGISRARFKAGIRQRDFNPFVNVVVDVDTDSEPFSKYELAKRLTGVDLPFNNMLKIERTIPQKKYDVLFFIDGRKRDHLLDINFIKAVILALINRKYKIVVVSGRESRDRIDMIKQDFGDKVELSVSPSIDELVNLILMSRCCISGNTGILHLSVASNVPTCGIFINADPSVWGYNFDPHFMIDARKGYPELNIVENFVQCSIEGKP